MPAIRLGSRDLLEYDGRYGVLICRKCQYAIQKSALRSHLLRHKIYRDERQRLLSSIAQFDLFEPHHVPLPTPASPPIDALPIISGYRCAADGCGNLCASSKRMRRHRNEIHGLSEPSDSSSFARSVKLQTFFRGTKLRYFEVASSPAAGAAGAAPLVTITNDDGKGYDQKGYDEQVHNAGTATPLSSPPLRRLQRPSGIPLGSSPVNLDLETLIYFHHFTTTTSLTLPSAEHPQSATHYWQTDVVLQALQQRWLMYGLLTISACHLAALVDDITIERVHRVRSAQFFSEFSAGWEETTKRDLVVMIAGFEEARKVGGQIRRILRCAHWASAQSMLDQEIILESAAPSQLQSIMTTIRGFVVADFALHPGGIQSDDNNPQEETFAQARRFLQMRPSSDAGSFGAFSSCDNTPSPQLNHLRALPYRMAETFGRPESARDVLATLSAIAALVECCDTSFASEEVGAAWQSMTRWLTKVTDHFNHMVSCHNAAALVVLAHWATSLVERVEHCGCWFLRGLAKTILLQIAERLPTDDLAVRSLVGSLMA